MRLNSYFQNNMIHLTKIFRFEAAHALMGYDGRCRNIHGHSYEMRVTIKGMPIIDDTLGTSDGSCL